MSIKTLALLLLKQRLDFCWGDNEGITEVNRARSTQSLFELNRCVGNLAHDGARDKHNGQSPRLALQR